MTHLEATSVLVNRILSLADEIQVLPDSDLRKATYIQDREELIESVRFLNPGVEWKF